MAALAAWSAASIAWADAPDLAWIDANRVAIGLCALAIGARRSGPSLRDAPRLFGLALAAGAAPAVLYALGTKVLPAWLGDDGDLARLAAPLGYWNALALVAVFAAPGLLWLAGGTDRPRWGPPVAGAGMALVTVTVLLTYSRGGLLSLLMAVAVTLAFLPGRGDGAGGRRRGRARRRAARGVRAHRAAPVHRPGADGAPRGRRAASWAGAWPPASRSARPWPPGSRAAPPGSARRARRRLARRDAGRGRRGRRGDVRRRAATRAAGRATACPSSAARAATPWRTSPGGW